MNRITLPPVIAHILSLAAGLSLIGAVMAAAMSASVITWAIGAQL